MPVKLNSQVIYEVRSTFNQTNPLLFLTGIAGYDPSAGRPKLGKWMKLVKEKTNPYYDEAHQIVNKLMMENSDIPEYFKGTST